MTNEQSYPPPDYSGRSFADVTVVVPTRNERHNISLLIDRLDRVCTDLKVDVLMVDDSTDHTAQVIKERAKRSSRRVRVIHRPASERHGGLGGAVLVGLREARSEWVCVMDGDLQHPPEVLAALIVEAQRTRADVVVASRYCARGTMGGFSSVRRMLSQGSMLVARCAFPRRLREVSDPMSGFFLVRRAAVDVDRLRPRGFKILLEILLTVDGLTVGEVPFHFGERHAGDSKASVRVGWQYLRRLAELRCRSSNPQGACSGGERHTWRPPVTLPAVRGGASMALNDRFLGD